MACQRRCRNETVIVNFVVESEEGSSKQKENEIKVQPASKHAEWYNEILSLFSDKYRGTDGCFQTKKHSAARCRRKE